MENDQFTLEVAQEFHRRISAITSAVQAGVWQAGVHELLGYGSDFGFGQKRGMQTLDLKTGHRSAHVRLYWDTILGNTDADKQSVADAIASAINQLS